MKRLAGHNLISDSIPRRVLRRPGDEPDLGRVASRGPRQAQLNGFDLHANVRAPQRSCPPRAALPHLLPPPLAQHRVQLRADGPVLVTLKTVWRDGTSHLLFEPIEFMEKLAAIIPPPAVNLVLYHGVLAPHARWRSHVVHYGRPAPDVHARGREVAPRAAGTPGAWTWAALMRRVFDLNALACPRCGGRRRLIATVEDPTVVGTILAHLGLLHAADSPGLPRRRPTGALPPPPISNPSQSRRWTLPLTTAA